MWAFLFDLINTLMPRRYCIYFNETVHSINARDYSLVHLNAWTYNAEHNVEYWQQRFKKNQTLVAVMEDTIVGFANLEEEGSCIGMLYVHNDFQGLGIATLLSGQLEQLLQEAGIKSTSAQVSITARPFFAKRGYTLIRDNRKVVRGVEFLNFINEKGFTLNNWNGSWFYRSITLV